MMREALNCKADSKFGAIRPYFRTYCWKARQLVGISSICLLLDSMQPALTLGFAVSTNNPHQRLGRILAMARVAQGLSRAQLGEKVNVSDETIRVWEIGKRSPDGIAIKQLADALNQDVELFWS